MAAQHDPVDWNIAGKIARVVAGPGPATSPERRAEIVHDLKDVTRRSDELVRAFTGLDPRETPSEPLVVDRATWIDANMSGFRDLVRPLAERISSRAPMSGITRRFVGMALGAQIGVLLGYLSQKVLGQYDLMLASGGAGRLYYIGPNIAGAESRFGFESHDFRLWIALHEVTHRTQFTGVPWLRTRVKGMIDRSLGSMDIDPQRVRQIVERGRELLFGGPAAWKAANIMSLLLTDQQRAMLEEVQALMTVIEGHGTFVMNRVGAREIEGFEQMRAQMEERRASAQGAEKVFQRAIGMDMKYEQYSLGERFCNEVADQAGVDAVNKLWERDGENMPSLQEMRDPAAWLKRVQA